MDKLILTNLYVNKSLSATKIARELGVSRDKVLWWLRKHEIEVRSKSETAYIQHNKQFAIKNDLTTEETMLYGMGLGLYWGEGNKASAYSVRLGNTDPKLIITFVDFLVKICGVQSSDIKYGLQVFNDSDPDLCMQYWQNILHATPQQFHPTISVIPPQGKGNYRRKNQFGVLQVYVNNKRLKEWLMNEIATYHVTYMPT